MNFVEVIAKKRDGLELSPAEVEAFVRGAGSGQLPDEQLAAMLMAICIRGASAAETQRLVETMRDSGELWRVGEHFPEAVDKHSTGGVGDTVSLVFTPLVAACGVPVAMMAGAGLGHTQGTLDKLSAIPGFATAASRSEAFARLARCGAFFAAQSRDIAPADRKLYLLRDTTATVPSRPLIVASIMSKKLAIGARRLVLDVKCGSGAFCKTLAEAQALAEALAAVGAGGGVSVAASITDMSQPLGDRLGSASEVRAAVAVLEGGGDARLRGLSVELGADALALAGRERVAARAELEQRLADGSALAHWNDIVRAHGGDPDPARLPRPRRTVVAPAARDGFVAAVAADELGWIAVELGAGRRRQDDRVDPAAGVQVHVRVGDRVDGGQSLATLEIGERAVDAEALVARAATAVTITEAPPAALPLVIARVGGAV